MRICLINPNLDQKTMLEQRTHLGIAYIAAYLRKHNYDVDVIDAPVTGECYKDIIYQLEEKKYNVIGISSYFYNYHSTLRLAKYIKKQMGTFVYLGGYLPTLSFDVLNHAFKYVDCMVIGEGEATTLNLINNLENNKWKKVQGICYLENGKVCYTGPSKLLNLDEIPFPERNIEKTTAYAQISAARGCYGRCSFCGINKFYEQSCGKYGSIRRRSPENVVQEIELLVKQYGVKHVDFVDDNFQISSKKGKEWVQKFCQLIKEKELKFTFNFSVRVNEILANSIVIEQMIEVGLSRVFIGVESFLDSHLKLYNKLVDSTMNLKAVQVLDNFDIKYEIGYILFNPITSMDDIIRTVEFFKKNKINFKHKHIWTPISGSRLNSIRGTDIYQFIRENNCFEVNESGYHFLDVDTEKCYRILSEQWIPGNVELFRKAQLYAQACQRDLSECANEIKQAYFELYYMDLELLDEIATGVKEKKLDDELIACVNDFIAKRCKISDKVNRLEKEILN